MSDMGPMDPTKNVLALVAAEAKRQDDLRELTTRFGEQMAAQREQATEEKAALRDQHAAELRLAEAKRIDAIRQVDTEAVTQAAVVADTRAAALAAQVAAAAETVRNAAEQARIQFAATLVTAIDPMRSDIADLRRVQYEQQGQRTQATETRGTSQWAVGTVIAGLAVAVAVIAGSVVYAESHNTAKPATPQIVVCQGVPVVCK